MLTNYEISALIDMLDQRLNYLLSLEPTEKTENQIEDLDSLIQDVEVGNLNRSTLRALIRFLKQEEICTRLHWLAALQKADLIKGILNKLNA